MVTTTKHDQARGIVCFGIRRGRLTARQLQWLLGYIERCRLREKP